MISASKIKITTSAICGPILKAGYIDSEICFIKMAHLNGNANGNAYGGGFRLKDESVENQRRMKVRVIGAGFSGILAAIRIPERLKNIDLVVYEKNEGIGGVW